MNIKYIGENNTTTLHHADGVTYMTFRKLDEAGVVHAFSTRLGGVSEGYLGEMNLSFHRGDNPENVMENHRRLAAAVGYDYRKLVFSDQVHGTRIYKVTEQDAGKGIVRQSDIMETDGLMTNVPGIALMTFYADCVPVYFYDPVNRVIAMNHSGWRGTVAKISCHMVESLAREYGTRAENLICAIGPSICRNCYEVDADVADEFRQAYDAAEAARIVTDRGDGKYLIDLHRANLVNLLQAGVSEAHIDVTDVCTCCNSGLLFSHRASHGKRGNLAAVISL